MLRKCGYTPCGQLFERNHKKQIYCSNKCRQAAWQAANKPTKRAAPGAVTVETEGDPEPRMEKVPA
jgi:hypothetical protein